MLVVTLWPERQGGMKRVIASRMRLTWCSPGRKSRWQTWCGQHTCLHSSAVLVEAAATMEAQQHLSRAELPGKTTTNCTCHNAAAQ